MEGESLRTYQTVSLSLPPKLVKAITSQAKQEGKTKSEFIREALRQYLQLKELRKAQATFSKRARELGVTEEAGVERIVDEARSIQARKKR
jgi:CopG family transcriptional regulator/antitoxin EndoAI